MQTSAVTDSRSAGVVAAAGAVAAHSEGSRGKGSAMFVAIWSLLATGLECKLRAGADAGRPARGDRLEPGVEAHALHAVDAVVAEDRGLPATEAVVGHRHRDRHVDADHADPDAAPKSSPGAPLAGG